jgi:hypothetical protein
MFRSTRRPYAAVTGTASAKQDKVLAHRGVRRTQNQALRQAQDSEDLLLPHKLECPGNNVWGWRRDGHQFLHFPPERDQMMLDTYWALHHIRFEDWVQRWVREYQKLKRK